MTASDTRPSDEGRVSYSMKAKVLSEADISRALKRIAHEIVERNHGLEGLVVVGIRSGGAWLARKLADELADIDNLSVPCGSLDISAFRDDRDPGTYEFDPSLSVEVEGSKVVLVDDVLCTGRTVRAAMEALVSYGRPAQVQLAVLIDRGHRELPIRADYVGKNLPTSLSETVVVTEQEVLIGELR